MEIEAIRDVFYWIQCTCTVLGIISVIGTIVSIIEDSDTAVKIFLSLLVTFLLITTTIALLKTGMNIQECYQ
jgi:hypothetical protein